MDKNKFLLRTHQLTEYFIGIVSSKAQKNDKARMDLEVSYIALRKIDLCEEKVFERLVLLVLMVSKRTINDIISCRTH